MTSLLPTVQSANGAMDDGTLLRIARDLLARPPGRRGGYVMTDAWLKRTIRSIERRRLKSLEPGGER